MVSANNYGRRLGIAILSLVISVQIASAQTFFTTTGKGDLLAGFRKTGGHPENNEFVVRLGQVTKFIGLPIGTTTNITIYGNSQVADAFPDNFGFLQWSVFSTFTEFPGGSNWNTAVGSFPDATCWFTIPRTATNVQSQAPTRQVDANQASLRESMLGIINGATYISGNLGVTNANNNSNLVVEPVISAYSSDILTANMADPGDATIGDFNGNSPYNSENTTPSPFSSPVISDFYQSCPSSTIDPFSGQTNGGAFYLGYFTLNANGTMTFTRQTNVVSTPPPPQPVLAISRTGTTSTISFGTTNGATYNLIYTTFSTLTNTPRSSWSTLGSSITGNGGITNFTDTTSDPGRVYSVTAH